MLYELHIPFPPSAVVDFLRTYYGPTHKAFAALDVEKQDALRQALEQLWMQHNSATGDTTSVDSEFLEVIAIRQ